MAKTIDDIYERQKRTVEASPVKFSISREDLKKGNYGNAWVMGKPNMLIGDLPQKPLTKEQAQAVARFLYDVLISKGENYE